MVHNDLICARSPVFNAACSERWTTSSQKPIELPEDSAEIFDIYLSCVYRDKVSRLTDRRAIKIIWLEMFVSSHKMRRRPCSYVQTPYHTTAVRLHEMRHMLTLLPVCLQVDAGNIDSKLTDDSNESVGERTRANRLLARTYILAGA